MLTDSWYLEEVEERSENINIKLIINSEYWIPDTFHQTFIPRHINSSFCFIFSPNITYPTLSSRWLMISNTVLPLVDILYSVIHKTLNPCAEIIGGILQLQIKTFLNKVKCLKHNA